MAIFLTGKRHTHRLFYGWYIVAAAFTILFFNAGARYSIGVMFKPMMAEFGWSRATVSLAFFLNMTVFALALTVVGKFYDRYGPRWILMTGTVFVAGGFMLTSAIGSLWQLFIAYGILAAVGLSATSVPLMAVLTAKWFEKRRGLAVSLALSGNSMGQFALVPLFTAFTLWYGWRMSYVWISIIMLVVNAVLVLFVIKGDPHQMGQEPYGSKERAVGPGPVNPSAPGPTVADFTLAQALRTRSLWAFLVVMFICGSGDFFITTHLIPFVTDYGVSPSTAGNMLGWYGLMSLFGILIAGPASDVAGNKLPIALSFLIRVALFALVLVYKNTTVFYILALAFGFTHLVTAPLTPTLVGKLFGVRHLGAITGLVNTVHHLAGGFWAYVAGVTFDRTGSYQLAFAISGVLALIAFVSTLLIREERHVPAR